MNKKIILSDLDSTLCDTSHRHHLSPFSNDQSSWLDYAMECHADMPMKGTIKALQLLSKIHPIYLVSGRSIEAHDSTIGWLRTYNVPYSSLKLRLPAELEDNAAYKLNYIQELEVQGFEIILMFEDWPPVVSVLEEHGIPVVCINPRYNNGTLSESL